MKNIVIMISHPDDLSNGMGGAALLLKDKYQLHVLCSTKGERGVPDWSMEKTAATREQEERSVCTILGAEVTFLGLIDGEVFASRDVCEKVAGILEDIDPVAFFTSWPVDHHPDHAATSAIARKAFHLWGHPEREFYFLAQGLGQTSQFIPDIYVDISEVMERKLELVRCHASQNTGNTLVDSVIQRNTFYANLGNPREMKYAEGFKMLHPHKKHTVLAELTDS